jgi:biopolymer transport protein ExbD
MRLSNRSVGERRLVELVPVVNVILLLMFFFLLSWSFVSQPGIEVKLPLSQIPTTTQQARHVVTIKPISKDDVLIFFDEKSVSVDELREFLRDSSEKVHGDWITVNADEAVPHGRVQQVASLAIGFGFHVTIATQRASNLSTPP